MTTKLFCSFTSLLRILKQEAVSPEELSKALYAFACTRWHVFDDPNTEASWFAESEGEQHKLLEVIRRYVQLAEEDNRVAWRSLEEGNMSYEKISLLLEQNGLNPIQGTTWYAYHTLKEIVEEANPEICVMF
jgi:hypothetical protein